MVAILLGDGFEEMEALCPCDCLRRAGVEVKLAAVGAALQVTGAHGITVTADCLVEALPEQLELLILPGGMGGVAAISGSPAALDCIDRQHRAGDWLAAICAAPTVLAARHVTDGRRATCYPGMEPEMGEARMDPDAPVVRDGKLITSTAAGSAMECSRAPVEARRGPQAADARRESLVYRRRGEQKE